MFVGQGDIHAPALLNNEVVSSRRRRAYELRDSVSAYDARYVVLAEALDCRLVTRDVHLAKAAKDLVELVVL